MHVLILYANPEPTSFCGALKAAAVATITESGHTVAVSDLYGEGFNPVAGRHDFLGVADPGRFHYQTEQGRAAEADAFAPDLKREQERFIAADLVIAIFPLWWSGPPAILKGWFDRVLAYGFAYVDGTRFTTGLFPHKRAMLCVTTGGTPQRFSAEDVYGPIEHILMPLQKLAFGYLGMSALPPFIAYGAPRVDDGQRRSYLTEWQARVSDALAAQGSR
jgi:NAD(P)H dehydrogenase (quinone)